MSPFSIAIAVICAPVQICGLIYKASTNAADKTVINWLENLKKKDKVLPAADEPTTKYFKSKTLNGLVDKLPYEHIRQSECVLMNVPEEILNKVIHTKNGVTIYPKK